MSELIIAPSVLSIDYSNTSEQLDALAKSNAKWLHFDVMDGHFVPNITFGQDVLRGMKKRTNLFMDVHLMVSDPVFYAPVFLANGADLISVHYEAFDDVESCKALCDSIRKGGCQCGVSIKPGTNVMVLEPLLPYIDLVLIMSVEPGFGGQSFQESCLEKISYLHHKKKECNYNYKIEVDGGINELNAKKVVQAGCDVLVAGSFIFQQDIVQGVDTLLCQK